MGSKDISVVKLGASNYLMWKQSLEAYCEAKAVWEIVSGEFVKPTRPAEGEGEDDLAIDISNWKRKDALARSIIMSSMTEGYEHLVLNQNTAFEMYMNIVNAKEKRTTSNVWQNRRKLTDLKFTQSHTVSSYFSELETCVRQLSDLGIVTDEGQLIIKILDDLPYQYESFRQTIDMQIIAGSNINVKDLKTSLLLAEARLNANKKETKGEALVSASNNKTKSRNFEKRCWECNGKGHTRSSCRKFLSNQNSNNFRANNNSNNNFNPNNNFNHNNNYRPNNNFNNRNFNNNRMHSNFNRPRSNSFDNRGRNNFSNNRNFNQNGQNRNHAQNSNFANNAQNNVNNNYQNGGHTNGSNNSFALTAGSNSDVQTEWLLDTGASFHLTSNIKNFNNLQELEAPIPLTIGDGKQIEAIAKGDCSVECFNGKNWVKGQLTDVLFVPDLGNFNLFSWGQCKTKGYGLRSIKDSTEIFDPKTGETIVIAEEHGNTFKLALKILTPNTFKVLAAKAYNLMDWHRRLAHVNVYKIMEMSKQGLLPPIVTDINLSDFVCDGCIKGKMHRQPFKSRPKRVFQTGEAMHCDLQGPMEVPSLGNSQFVLVIKDEASSFRNLFFLKHKSDAINSLTAYVDYVERKTSNKVKIMRSDNGGEFIDVRVKSLLRNKNIVHELSAPYTPEQNGLIERENRTIVELARSMLQDMNLPKFLWAEAMHVAMYVLNLLPTKQNNNLSPFELWYKKKPNYEHLRVFGSVVYAKVPDATRKKWDAKARKYIFIGYTYTPENYKIFDPRSNSIFISREVKFVDSTNNIEEAIKQVQTESIRNLSEMCQDEETDEMNEEDLPTNETVNVDDTNEQEVNDKQIDIINLALQAIEKSNEPTTYEEAMASPDRSLWLEAMKEELKSFKKNDVYTITTLPQGKRPIDCRWVFRIKRKADGSIERYKARLVAKGFAQKSGVDYFETFSPVARYDSIRAILAITAFNKMFLKQFDVKTAFLYGDLEEEIYINQPPGFADNSNNVLKLKKGLYGLKQAPRQWNEKVKSFFNKHNFTQTKADNCVYVKNSDHLTICVIYVDDGLISSTSEQELLDISNALQQTFEMKFGEPSVFVGMEINQSSDRSVISIKQSHYIKQLLKRFGMQDCKPVVTPGDTNVKLIASEEEPSTKIPYQEAVGALLYLSIISRPDITFQVNRASQFNARYNQSHWIALKRVFRYLAGTVETGIVYCPKPEDFELIGYADADYASDSVTRKSTSGFVVTLGNAPISWASRLQKSVAQSTTEAEYVAIADCTKDILWYIQLCKELNIPIQPPIRIMSDNQGAILLTKNSVFHKRTKHIDVRFHAIRDYQEQGLIKVYYTPTDQQPADMLTKSLCSPSLIKCKEYLNIF